ncbi:MAG TPA: amidohydrolase family protein [Bacillota bacterium]
MGQFALTKAAALTPFELIEEATVLISHGRILAVGDGATVKIPEGFQEIPLEGLILAPGLIDQHPHREVFLSGNVAGLIKWARFYATHGVTAFLATTAFGTFEQLYQAAASFNQLTHSDYKGAQCLGIHLEGSGLIPGPDERLRYKPLPLLTVAEVEQLQQFTNSGIKAITLAPELPGALAFAAAVTKRGISCSIGYSNADWATVVMAVENGFSCVVPCFNQADPLSYREPKVIETALLHKGLSVELVVDSQILSPANLELIWQHKGADGIILVSDGVMPSGYFWGGDLSGAGEGRCHNPAEKSAGSGVTLEQVIRNFWKGTGCNLSEAFITVTYNPAKRLGLVESKGSLAPGKDADIIAVTPDFDVVMTMIGGEVISGLIVI